MNELSHSERKIIWAKRQGAKVDLTFYGSRTEEEALKLYNLLKHDDAITALTEGKHHAFYKDSSPDLEYTLWVSCYKKEDTNE